MKVILLEKIRRLGGLGDQVQVAPGYGRNYLIPQGKAKLCNEKNLRWLEQERALLEQQEAKALAQAQQRAAVLEQEPVRIQVRVGSEDRLYGSIGSAEIVKAVADKGIELTAREVYLPQGRLSQLGEYEVSVQLHSDVAVQLKVVLSAQTR